MVAVRTVSVMLSAPLHITECAVDGMVFTRGSKDDWDRLAETVEDDGLKWDNMTLYMLKVCSPFTRKSFPSEP